MVKFETLKADEVKFGANNFIEIARKKAITDEGENTFLSISRGFVDKMGNRRYRTSVTIPLTADVIDFVSSGIKTMGAGGEVKSEAKKHAKKEEALEAIDDESMEDEETEEEE